VYVREGVLTMLGRAAQVLEDQLPGAQLEVAYGYRALSIQIRLFEGIRASLVEDGFDGTEADLLEAVHRMVAVPDVAGHPTGGAVDIQVVKGGVALDMGTPIWDFVEDSYTFSPYISDEAKENRMLLRSTMESVGFVPFDGEWWHYSYGDPEWVAAVGAPYAIYDQVEFRADL
jgi:zinc D-Ala-D-Ala dipeptidase